MTSTRAFTTRTIELVEEGMFENINLIYQLLNYLSEDEVKDFVRRNDFYGYEDLGFRCSWVDEDEEETA
jgi:hypothetical protein